jgi:transcription elongation factor Elf1
MESSISPPPFLVVREVPHAGWFAGARPGTFPDLTAGACDGRKIRATAKRNARPFRKKFQTFFYGIVSSGIQTTCTVEKTLRTTFGSCRNLCATVADDIRQLPKPVRNAYERRFAGADNAQYCL